jgi:hypothetical protein
MRVRVSTTPRCPTPKCQTPKCPIRRWLALVAPAMLVVAGVAGGGVIAATCWRPPVVGTVVDPFRAPPCPWCPGNRGLEYDVGDRTPVTAASAGIVTFAGTVAGVRYVVIDAGDGRRQTYGRLATMQVGVGDRIVAAERVGSASGRFFFGVRRGDEYLDPAPLLGELRARPRLVPLDGAPRRAGSPTVLRCPAHHVSLPSGPGSIPGADSSGSVAVRSDVSLAR